VQAAALSSSGRFMYWSAGGSILQMLDLQTLARQGASLNLEGNILSVQATSANQIYVATTSHVYRLTLENPLKVQSTTKVYTKPTSLSAYTAIDACILNSGAVAFLDRHSQSSHQIRLISATGQESRNSNWASLTGQSTSSPWALLCSQTRVFGMALNAAYGTATKMFIFEVSAVDAQTITAAREVYETDQYRIRDALLAPLSATSFEIFVALERATPISLTSDVLIRRYSSALAQSGDFAVGSGFEALASLRDGAEFRWAYAIGEDRLKNASFPPENQWAVGRLPFESIDLVEEFRGASQGSVSRRRPSRWLSSATDHYAWGLTQTRGVEVLGRGPKIILSQITEPVSLQQDGSLSFRLRTDVSARIEIRFKADEIVQNPGSAFEASYGNLLQSFEVAADTDRDVSLPVANLGITKEGEQSLLITATDLRLNGTSAPVSRKALRVDYDLPPEALNNFRLGFGDQSVHVFFQALLANDIDYYVIHFSFNEADLEESALSNEARSVDTGISGYSLTSPVIVPAAQWSGSRVIAPIQNGRTLYVRAYAVDEQDQRGPLSPVLSQQAYRTLSVSDALGGPQSCALSPSPHSLWWPWVLGFFVLLGFWRKNWARRI
jgi:hypothetical protein